MVALKDDLYTSFEEWTGQRRISYVGTNAGATQLPFQGWRNFKEAFAPELIAEAIQKSKIPVRRCLDPFGGSGTTALACQFTGVHPITIEVNPFLADLIEAKLTIYDVDRLARDLGSLINRAQRSRRTASSYYSKLPPSFIEPGMNGRWIFDLAVANKLAQLQSSIEKVHSKSHRRFFSIILGGMLIGVSNVLVSGKGRRYRKNWAVRADMSSIIFSRFIEAAGNAISEIGEYSRRACGTFQLLRGDSRKLISKAGRIELCVFSPPYPNSFDYTDIYNVELWMLGYLRDGPSNRALRSKTFSSHVQILRKYPAAPCGSRSLGSVVKRLRSCRSDLWSPHLPEMVSAYFADMLTVLKGIRTNLHQQGAIWMVVGNSRYANILIPTAKIISELVGEIGLDVERRENFRSMRTSAQQGGRRMLAETLLVLSPR